jgi:hypothetical protein
MVNEEINDDRLLIYRNADRRKLHKRSLVGGFNHSQHEQTFCGTEYSPGSDLPRFRFEPPLRETGFSNQVDSSITANVNLLRRASGFPQGCPQDMKVLYMGVAADCEYTDTYGGSDGALRQIITDWNQASQVFQKSFNIMLAIHTINLLTECDSAVGSLPWNQKCSSSYSISQRLSDFSKWRGQPAQKDPNGLWVLVSVLYLVY